MRQLTSSPTGTRSLPTPGRTVRLPPLNQPAPAARRRKLRSLLLWALLHFMIVLTLGGLIFFSSHVPPKAVNLDGLIRALVWIENILLAPRKALLWLWPGESTPPGLGFLLTLVNSLAWGAVLAWTRAFWRKATT